MISSVLTSMKNNILELLPMSFMTHAYSHRPSLYVPDVVAQVAFERTLVLTIYVWKRGHFFKFHFEAPSIYITCGITIIIRITLLAIH